MNPPHIASTAASQIDQLRSGPIRSGQAQPRVAVGLRRGLPGGEPHVGVGGGGLAAGERQTRVVMPYLDGSQDVLFVAWV